MQQHHHLTAKEWHALASDPEYLALVSARRRVVMPSVAFALLFYLMLPLAMIFFPDYLRARIAGGMTRAVAFALLEFAMSWLLLALYMFQAKRFDDRASRIAERARERFAS